MQNFEERKNKYLSYLLHEYAPQKRNGLPSYQFMAVEDYKFKHKGKKSFREELVIQPTLGKYVILITIVLFIVIASIDMDTNWYGDILLFVVMVLVLSSLFYVKIGKAVVIINSRSIFIQGNADIGWENVIMTYFKTYYSDGEIQVYSMIIHYYDEGADTFRETEIPLTGLSTNPEEIAFYVKKFSK